MKKVYPFLIILFAMIVSACQPEPAPTSKEYEVLNNDLAEGRLTVDHYIPGENFKFVTSYSTAYNAAEWHITDSKTLNMEAWIEPIDSRTPITATILVEHVHIDATITSEYALMNGVLQDTMDDKLHVGNQPGFLISEEYPYENIFVIEGLTQYLIDGWGYYNGSYGYSSIEQVRLTEANLINHGGVNGNKFSIVYDILVKYEGDEYFHTRSVIDEFVVPVSGPKTDNHETTGASNALVAPRPEFFAKDITVLYEKPTEK